MTGEHPTILEQLITHADKPRVALNRDVMFGRREDIEAYEEYRQTMPLELQEIVKGFWQGKPAVLRKDVPPIISEFQLAIQRLLANPNSDLDIVCSSGKDTAVKYSLARLKELEDQDDKKNNLFSLLQNPNYPFKILRDYLNVLAKEQELLVQLNNIRRENYYSDEEEQQPIKIKPPEEPKNSHVGRAPMQESKEKPTEAIATIYPFYGGYYKGRVGEEFDINRFEWKPGVKKYFNCPDQLIDQTKKRIYRSAGYGDNHSNIIKLPYNWGIDKNSINWIGQKPSNYKFIADNDGLVYLQITEDEHNNYPFKLDIGPSEQALKANPPSENNIRVSENFPPELETKTSEILATDDISDIVKAKRIVAFIQSQLEYDLADYSLEEQYKSNPLDYYVKIWNNKKAKCDEANTLTARWLQKNGFQVRYITGHSAQSKSDAGEALLLDSNRHAWLEVWDKEQQQWQRMDATPAGDPNVDSDEQQQDLGEGDYGEQEAPILTEQEAEQRLKKLEEMSYSEDEIEFAQKAECKLDEAREILAKINNLEIKFATQRELMIQSWLKVVRKNYKAQIEYDGPVAKYKSTGEIKEGNLVAKGIQEDAGVPADDVVAYERDVKQLKEHKAFGGFEVYIAVDLSGSMNDEINGVKKVDSQRDMVFLLIDSIMTASEETRHLSRLSSARGGLRTEMPVRICLVTFGKTNQIVLPLCEQWGPKEKLAVYQALDSGAGGTTLDHLALSQIERTIVESKETEEQENNLRHRRHQETAKMERFVLVSADGGSDNDASVKAIRERLEKQDIPVRLFLLSLDNDEYIKKIVGRSYGNFASVRDMTTFPGKGVKWITDELKQKYK